MSEPTAIDLAAAASDAQVHELNGIVQADARKGAVVHVFDPSASPQAKAASTRQGIEQLKGISAAGNLTGGKDISLDSQQGPSITPTITVSDADQAHADELGRGDGQGVMRPQTATDNEDFIPGTIPDTIAASIPDWYRVGWRAVGAIDKASPTSQEEIDKAALAEFIKEQYYGEWYHNAGIIFFSVAATHFLTLFNMGWGSLLIVLAFCATYYSTSLARVRRRARDDIQRELVKTRLLSEHETADWMNNFLHRFWLIYEPILSTTIISSVDQILSVNTPSFLDSIQLTTFTLGNKAPRIESVRTYPNTPEDIVEMEWKISFTPNDISDLTPRQAEARVNPKIVLQIRLGKGIATAGMPILLEDITFEGEMRIKMKLVTNFPHVQIVDISFIREPIIDYVLKPIGGEHFGFDIANIPGLSTFVRDMTHSTLRPMMYAPNEFTLNLEQLLSGTPIDSAIGVLQVTLHSAHDLKATKIGGGTPDPYVSISINQRAELAQTKRRDSTFNPSWHETKFILINSLTEALSMSVMDYNEHRKDSNLGIATFELVKLREDVKWEGLTAPVVRDGKNRGELRFDVTFYPVLIPKKVDGKEEPLPETSVGIVRLTLHQAKDLDHTKFSGDLNPSARVFLDSSRDVKYSTRRVKHTSNPVWESSTEFLCTDRASSVITIKVIDDRDFLSDPTVGYLRIKLDNLLEAKRVAERDWWPLDGCKTGRLRLSAEWKPLKMAGNLQGVDKYTPPIGIVRLWVQRATDIKNVEAALGGKSDPYVRVLLNNIIMARTEVINNNLNPEWDQIMYVPVHSPQEVMRLECMDYQNLTKDRSLGTIELLVKDLVKTSIQDKDHSYTSTGRQEHVSDLRFDKDNVYKGQLHYVAEFVPAIPLKDVRFDAPQTEIQHAIEEMVDSSDVGEHSTRTSLDSRKRASTVTVTPDNTHEGDAFQSSHGNGLKSTDTTQTFDTVNTMETTRTSTTSDASGTVEESHGVELSKAELLKYNSGVIVFNLIGGQLAKKSRLEVFLDDGCWPIVATAKSGSTNARFDHVGEGFAKELDFSQVWLRLNANEDSDKEDIVAECRLGAKAFLEQALDGPATFSLRKEDDKNESTVEIAAKFIPVHVTLEPRESTSNQGILRVDLIEGKDILAADRSGKSDPYAVFTLNGQKVFRSQVKKKTLAPDWNETFEVSVPSRVGSRFEVEVLDWNQIEQSKSLGTGSIDLESIEPSQLATRIVTLSTPKHGDIGIVRIILFFEPTIIFRSRRNATISTAGRAMSQAGGIPLNAGKGLVLGVGAAGKTMKGVFMRDHNRSNSSLEIPSSGIPRDSLDHSLPIAQLPRLADVISGPSTELPTSEMVTASPSSGGSKFLDDFGMLKVTVLGAKDLVGASVGDPVKAYVVVKVGEKEQKTKHTTKTVTPEWDETFRFVVGPETRTFVATILDHKTIGRDRHLGEAVVDIWSHIRPSGPAADIWVELLEREGLLRLRLEVEKGKQESLLSVGGSPPSSPSRFLSSRRSIARDRS